NGSDAIIKIDHNSYDVILTDIIMPEISGDQILQYVKLKKGNTPPVIGMSGTPWLLD
ncbi:MAG: response regulator, partial [Desulfobacteraceae bacterium]|nr:response regulator [Desulfobacteraceae bacterium]